MPRRLFKHLSRQRHHWKAKWFMKPFEPVLGDPAYWSLNRRNLTRAVALGLFIAFIPLPLHILLAALLAIALRVNVPVTLSAVFFTNPLTIVPLYYAAYWTGCHLLGLPVLHRLPHRSAETLLPVWQGPFWQPFLLGSLVLGLVVAVAAYILVGALLHTSLVRHYYRRKRMSRSDDELEDRSG